MREFSSGKQNNNKKMMRRLNEDFCQFSILDMTSIPHVVG